MGESPTDRQVHHDDLDSSKEDCSNTHCGGGEPLLKNLQMENESQKYPEKPAGTRRKDKTYADTWARRERMLNGMTYAEYLKCDEWLGIKAEARKRAYYQSCYICGSPDRLEIHHKTYKYIGTKRAMEGLIPLCRNCHESVHVYAREKNMSVRRATNQVIKQRKAG